jgi:hypothetical protein
VPILIAVVQILIIVIAVVVPILKAVVQILIIVIVVVVIAVVTE